MALNLAKVVGYLKDRPEEKFTTQQIAEWVFAIFPAECQAKKESSRFITNDAELVQQLVAEISSQRPVLQKRRLELKMTESQPRKYYYSEKSDSAEVAAVESAAVGSSGDASARAVPAAFAVPVGIDRRVFQARRLEADEKRSSNKHRPNDNR